MSSDAGGPLLTARLAVTGWRCVVVGGGSVAARRAKRLVDAGAVVTVVAPEVTEAIRSLPVEVAERGYRAGDLAEAKLVVTATGVDEVDRQVVEDASAAGLLVNDATDPSRSTVIIPAASTVGTVSISVDTGGRSPALASWLNRRFVDELADGVAELAEMMGSTRDELVAAGHETTHPGWIEALDSGLLDLIRQGRTDEARRLLRSALGLAP